MHVLIRCMSNAVMHIKWRHALWMQACTIADECHMQACTPNPCVRVHLIHPCITLYMNAKCMHAYQMHGLTTMQNACMPTKCIHANLMHAYTTLYMNVKCMHAHLRARMHKYEMHARMHLQGLKVNIHQIRIHRSSFTCFQWLNKPCQTHK